MTVAIPGAVELHRVTCPYCLIGFATVEVTVNAAQQTKQIEGMCEPRRCSSCKKYFRLRPTIQIVGEKLNGR